MTLIIESPQNPRIKRLVALRQKKERLREGVILVEGVREIQAALSAGHVMRECYSCADYLSVHAEQLLNSEVFLSQAVDQVSLSTRAFEKVAVRDHAGGIIGLFQMPDLSRLGDCKWVAGQPLLILDRIEKPGNLGAILRTADAAGVSGLVIDGETVDPFSPNVIRASLGAVFTVPIFFADRDLTIKFCKDHAVRTLAADPDAAEWHFDQDLKRKVAFILGSEAFGVSKEWMAAADRIIKIPMIGTVNSLNVSVAAAIVLYEQVRQRHS